MVVVAGRPACWPLPLPALRGSTGWLRKKASPCADFMPTMPSLLQKASLSRTPKAWEGGWAWWTGWLWRGLLRRQGREAFPSISSCRSERHIPPRTHLPPFSGKGRSLPVLFPPPHPSTTGLSGRSQSQILSEVMVIVSGGENALFLPLFLSLACSLAALSSVSLHEKEQ